MVMKLVISAFVFIFFKKNVFFLSIVRQKFQGVSRERAFIAWKKWVWTKQKRIARDLRRQYKTAIKWVRKKLLIFCEAGNHIVFIIT